MALGHYCNQGGLQYDQGALIHPDPDPVRAEAERDPQVQAAALLEAEAQGQYEEADAAWAKAVADLSAVRLKAKSDEGIFTINGGWRPSIRTRSLAAQQKSLTEDVKRLWKARERAGEALIEARVYYTRTLAEAGRSAGLATLAVNLPREDHMTIPNY